MQMTGRLVEILPARVGTNLEQDMVAGSTVLPVTLAMDFDQENGGEVEVGGVVYAYTSVDNINDTLTISPGLAVDAVAGEPISIPGTDATTATVVSEETEASNLMVTAQLDHSLKAMFEAQRWDFNTGPLVTLDDRFGQWTIIQVHDYIPKLLADTLEGRVPPETLSDGEEPQTASVPLSIPGLGSIFIRTSPVVNEDAVTYEYHISTDPMFVAVPRDPATLLLETPATMISTKTLADGTPLLYDTLYYVVTIVRDADGPGPQGPAVTASMSKVDRVDITANSITAEEMAAIISLAMLFRTAEVGERLEIGLNPETNENGLRIYDSTGACIINLNPAEAVFAGTVLAQHFVSYHATLRGLTEGPPGGEFQLQATITESPSLPLATSTLPEASVPLDLSSPEMRIAKAADSNRFLSVQARIRGLTLQLRNLATGTVENSYTADIVPQDPALYPTSPFTPRGVATKPGYILSWGDYTTTKIVCLWSTGGADYPGSSNLPYHLVAGSITAPGTGGYAANEPVYGLSQATDHLLVAHRVQGAQTIGGVAYADKEMMVRVYSYVLSGTGIGRALTPTLVRTIKSGRAPSRLNSILCNNPNAAGTFDLSTTASRAGYAISGEGLAFFGEPYTIIEAPITGATATANIPAAGATSWFGWTDSDLVYASGAFYASAPGKKSLAKFNSSNSVGANPQFAYTYYNSGTSQETKLSPIKAGLIFKRFKNEFSLPEIPPGVTQVRLYGSRDTTLANFDRIGTYTAVPGSPLLLSLIPPTPPAGAPTNPAPTVSNYVAPGNPYRMYSTLGGYQVTGEGKGGWPLMDQCWSEQKTLSTAAQPNSTTNVGMTGLSSTVDCPGTSAVYKVQIDASVRITVTGTTNIIELLVDGATYGDTSTHQIVHSGAASQRGMGTGTWRITGLSAGSHTFSARTRNTAASTGADILSAHTVMTVERKQ